jgi:O-antigen/teichoic acid export membrane protein
MTVIQIYKNIRNNRHFDNFKKFAIGGILSILLGYISTYLINKHLSKEDLGLFSYHQSVMILLTSIFSMGVHHAYLRFNNENANQKELANIIRKITIITTLGLFFFSYLLFGNIYISALSFIILFNERIYFYRSSKRIRRMNFLKYFYYSMLIILICSFIYYGGIDYKKVILALGSAYLLIYIGDFVYGKYNFQQSDKSKIIIPVKKLFLYSLPLAGAEVVRWILEYSDQVLMKEFLSIVDLANYAIAVRILNVVKIFTSLFLLYYPMLYFEEADKGNYNVIKKIRLSFSILLSVVAIVLILFRKQLYIVMGADQYVDYTEIFLILIIAEIIRIIASLYLIYRTYKMQTLYNIMVISVCATVSLGLNYLLLADYGVVVAALVQLITALLYFIIVYFVAIRQEMKQFDT